MRLYFVYLHNNADPRDDEVVKVRAKTPAQARVAAQDQLRGRFSMGRVMTRKQLKRFDPEWHALLWGQKPQEAY